METFATIDDYIARYGEPADTERTTLLLQDASNMLLAAYEDVYGEYEQDKHATFDRNAPAVACLLVNRILTAPADLLGATQYSQGVGGYSASVSYGSALGEMYLGKTDLKRLGLLRQAIGALKPHERGKHHGAHKKPDNTSDNTESNT